MDEQLKIIVKIQEQILALQGELNNLRATVGLVSADDYITRQEAANLMDKSLRQMDRDCDKYGIRRKRCNGGIRVNRKDVYDHLNGVLYRPAVSDFERIVGKYETVSE